MPTSKAATQTPEKTITKSAAKRKTGQAISMVSSVAAAITAADVTGQATSVVSPVAAATAAADVSRYVVPRKVAMRSERLKADGLRGVPIGYLRKQSFEKDVAAFGVAVAKEGGWTPAEIHFKINKLYLNWNANADPAAKARVDRMKAWIEQEWPEAFTNHKDIVTNRKDSIIVD